MFVQDGEPEPQHLYCLLQNFLHDNSGQYSSLEPLEIIENPFARFFLSPSVVLVTEKNYTNNSMKFVCLANNYEVGVLYEHNARHL